MRDKLFVMTYEDGTAMTCKGGPGVQLAERDAISRILSTCPSRQ